MGQCWENESQPYSLNGGKIQKQHSPCRMVSVQPRLHCVLELGTVTLGGTAVGMMRLAFTPESSCSPQCHGCSSQHDMLEPLTFYYSCLLGGGGAQINKMLRQRCLQHGHFSGKTLMAPITSNKRPLETEWRPVHCRPVQPSLINIS